MTPSPVHRALVDLLEVGRDLRDALGDTPAPRLELRAGKRAVGEAAFGTASRPDMASPVSISSMARRMPTSHGWNWMSGGLISRTTG